MRIPLSRGLKSLTPLISVLEHGPGPNSIRDLCFSHTSSILATSASDGSVRVTTKLIQNRAVLNTFQDLGYL